ncbi:MAG: aspartate aminotransferase family protein [Bilifractor sp.]|jgi:glutamate-1-semialdehyde 2,1-aminomutase
MKMEHLDGFDYDAIHERAAYVLKEGKKLRPDAEAECLKWFDDHCQTSKAKIEEAKSIIPGGVQHNLANNHPWALDIVKAEGPYLYDIDGNRYIDFCCAGGPTILGNSYPPIKEAIIDEVNTCGYLTGLFNDYEYKLAQKVKEFFPSVEKFRMLGTGTESVMAAIRAARAYTGKKYIIKLKGCYHGWSDQVVYDIRACNSRGDFAAGIPEECYKYTQAVMVNDADALEKLFIENESRGGTAAFLVEAMGQDSGCLPTTREYHHAIRELCDKYGVVLIYDEVVTAFRLALGGAQEYFHTHADLTVFGKIIAGGLPSAGGLGGKEEIMSVLTSGVSHQASKKKIVVGGTLTANPVSARAGYTALCEIQKHHVPEKLDAAAEDFCDKVLGFANKYNVPAIITHQGSVLQIDLTGMKHVTTFDTYSKEEAAAKRKEAQKRMVDFSMALAANGVITAGGNKTFFNYASLGVLDEALAAYEKVFSYYAD